MKIKTNQIVVFSGAGMSAESGISTFRDSGGLWEQYKIEEVATPEAWKKNPLLVQQFYNFRRKQIIECKPNNGHIMIAQLGHQFPVTVITQNIDDLHERAGSKNVMHLHGNIRLSKSSGPNSERNYFPIDGWALSMEDRCPEGYVLRPHVVWFGEEVPMLSKAAEIISKAEILIVIGTSLNVYPAAGLIHYAMCDAHKYIIDPNVHEFSLPTGFKSIQAGAEEGLRQLLKDLQ